MNYIEEYEAMNKILYILKIFIINIGTFLLFLKLTCKNNSKRQKLITIVLLALVSVLFTIFKDLINSLNAMTLMMVLLVVIFLKILKIPLGYTIITTVVSASISNVLFFISTIINGIPNMIFSIYNDNISFLFISIVYIILLYGVMKIKKMKNGFSFIYKKPQNELFDILILNASSIILFLIEFFGNYDIVQIEKMGISILILSVIMYITIKKSFDVYYNQKNLLKQLEENEIKLANQEKEIQRLEQENLNFSKRSHSLAHKQKSLEYKIEQLILKEETAEEIAIKEKVQDVSKELYQCPIEDLPPTEITEIDDMFKCMQAECIKNNIDFSLKINGNIHYLVNNIISSNDLEILIADHIKDAIIAVNHTENVNKSIFVRLGKIEGIYSLYIYDSGVEFKKEVLQNLGKKPSTTYKDEGGTGMGFINTFETLRKCKGSLIINEIGVPSKDNYTKVIMIKFDNKNNFTINSYKE